MSLNSVNTNMGAMVALQSLNQTITDLAATQKRISTGLRVADATDDGAAFAVAQTVRTTVGGLTTANQQLGNVAGLLSTTQSGLTNIQNTMESMRNVLVKLADANVSGSQRTAYVSQYQSLLVNVNSFIMDTSYSGKTLIGSVTGNPSNVFGRVLTVRNEAGQSYGMATYSGCVMFKAINFGSIAAMGTHAAARTVGAAATPSYYAYATAAKLITAGGTFMKQFNAVGSALNLVGAENTYVTNQISFNKSKIDALNSGLGALVDADLAKESANLTALNIRQQLGTQALSLANQAPQTLLSLFK